MSRGIYDLCTCGHRHPEHSLFGTCRGCVDCPDVESRPSGDADTFADDHPYSQCECRAYVHDEAATAADADARMEPSQPADPGSPPV